MRWLFVLVAACGSASAPAQAPAVLPDLDYTLKVVPGALEVTVATTAVEPVTTFAIDHWANVDDPETSVRHVTAIGGALEPKPPRAWAVRAPVGTRIALRYELFQPNPPTDDDRFRTTITPTFIHLIATLALAVPDRDGADEVTARYTWKDLGALHAATSFGTEPTVTVHDKVESLRDAVFVAARDLRVTKREVGKGTLEVATVGPWKFTDAAFADRIAKVIMLERGFFDDAGPPYFFVSAWPIGKGENYGGTGLTHSFDLAMSSQHALDADIDLLLAHEHFHNWNGRKIAPEAFEELTYWVTEGFTVFYASRLRYRGGMRSLGDYAKQVNSELREYLLSPVKDIPNAKIAGGFWSDENGIGRVPYTRGNAIALVADREIRKMSDGRTSLDDVMRALVTSSNPRITSERMLAMIEGLTSTAFAARLRATAIDGAPLAIPLDLFAPCLVGTQRTVYRFDLGFDWPATKEAKVIHGVQPGSSAARAGLHDGDALTGGISITFGNSDKLVELDVGSPKRHISYLPRGAGVEVPEFAVGDASACDAILGKPF